MAETITTDGDDRTVEEAGEAATLDLIRKTIASLSNVATTTNPRFQLLVGNGDDAAVAIVSDPLVISCDVLVEGQHFRWDWSSHFDVGRKAIAVNAADIEAMGARMVAVVVGLALPRETTLQEVANLYGGLCTEARRAGAQIVGGDLATAPILMLSATAHGIIESALAPVTLAGARPGEVLAITGKPGQSRAGMELLVAGRMDPEFVGVHRVPDVPYGAGALAAENHASAMTDVSDGLLRDARTIALRSQVCLDINTDCLPGQRRFLETGFTLDQTLRFQLDGGEDHGLLATFPPESVPEGFTVIGRVVAAGANSGQGKVLVDGVEDELASGWDSMQGSC